MRTTPAQKKWPNPKRMPERTLIETPITVNTFGLMRRRAKPRTIAPMIRLAPRPMLAPNNFLPTPLTAL